MWSHKLANLKEGYVDPVNLIESDPRIGKKRNEKAARKGKNVHSAHKSGKNAESEQVFCICRTPYDSTRPMIQCDYCENWFHFDCVNMTKVSFIA